MEQVSITRERCSGSPARIVSNDKDIPRIVDRIFMRMAAIYGNSWSRNFPTSEALSVAKSEWIDVIKNVPTDIIKLAFDSIIRGNQTNIVSRPPNLIEFRLICSDIQARYFSSTPKNIVEFKKGDIAVANEAMDRIRKMLNMPKRKDC